MQGLADSEDTASESLSGKSDGSLSYLMVPEDNNVDFTLLQNRVRQLEDDLNAKTFFLMKSCNLTLQDIKLVYQSSPKLKVLSLNSHIKPILSRLSTEFQLNATSLGKLLMKFPTFLYPACSRQFDHIVAFLEDLGINRSDFHRILTSRPQIFALKIERNLNYTVNFLLGDVCVPRHKLAKMLTRCPHVITLSVDRKLRPALQFLQSLGLSKEEIGALSAIYPHVFLFDIEKKMLPTVRYLRHELNISSSSLRKLVYHKPQLLGYSVGKKLRLTVKFLVEEAGVPRDRIGDFILGCPAMLGYSVDKNLRPTLNYIRTACNITGPEGLLRYPRMLSYSLERRIKPRVESLAASGHKLTTMGDVFHYMKQKEMKVRKRDKTAELSTIHVF